MAATLRPILAPVELFGQTLPNRLVVAPMSRVSATEAGLATDAMRDYYGRFAQGGFAVVITEGAYTDAEASQGYDRQPGIANERQAASWAPIAAAIAAAGGLPILQLMHAGALTQRRGVARTLAPSAVRPRGEMMPEYGGRGPFPMPTAMTADDLRKVREEFVRAAARARRAGFHGVEVHAANGYLLDQFITDYTNLRDDGYGGSASERVRYPAEIVSAIRAASPSEFIVGVRVSEAKVNDFDHRWSGGAVEATTIVRALADAGAGYLHVAGEGRGFRESLQSDREPLTTLARRVTGLPVIANGGLHDADLADGVIDGGHADLVSIGRAALATPDWPHRIATNQPVVPFSHEMTSPSATLQQTEDWFLNRPALEAREGVA